MLGVPIGECRMGQKFGAPKCKSRSQNLERGKGPV